MSDNKTEKTEDQLAAEKASRDAAAAAKKAEKAEAKKVKDEAAAKAKADKAEADKVAKAAAEQAKKDAAAAKEAEKAAAKAAKEATKMPEANNVRRPKPETLCGQAWAVFDEVSAKNGQPASIKESLEVAKGRNLNEGNVRVEYARWRKFFGVTGRVQAPGDAKPADEAAPAAQ